MAFFSPYLFPLYSAEKKKNKKETSDILVAHELQGLLSGGEGENVYIINFFLFDSIPNI